MRLRLWFTSLVWALVPGLAFSDCLENKENDPFREAKQNFLQGNYTEFLDQTQLNGVSRIADRKQIQSALDEGFAGGFDECHTILFEIGEPRLLKELTLFNSQSNGGLLVGWIGMMLEDPIMGKFWITTEFEELEEFWN